MTRLKLAGLGLIALSLGCFGCDEEPEDPCRHRIGLVTNTGAINDLSFNQSAWNGVRTAAAALSLPDECVDFIETVSEDDWESNIDSFVERGFDIVVTSGFPMAQVTREAGRRHPEVFFIGTDQVQVDADGTPDAIPNVAGLVFHDDAGGFLAGALAGLITETDHVSAVFACAIPPVVRFSIGYANGVRHVNPDAEVTMDFHEFDLSQCFINMDFGVSTAQTQVEAGSDVVFGGGGLVGNGALVGGCNGGARVIGVDFDQFQSVPEVQSCIVSSATKDIVGGVADLVAQVDEGTFEGGDFYGGVALAPFHEFESVISDEVKSQLEDLSLRVGAGEIATCEVVPELGDLNDMAFCVPIE